VQQSELDKIFDYIPPDDERVKLHTEIRRAFKGVAEVFNGLITDEWTDEAGMVYEKLQEAMFWANAHIARHE
jgi:hypothetical protein